MTLAKIIGVLGFCAMVMAQQKTSTTGLPFYPEPTLEVLPDVAVDPDVYEINPGDTLMVVVTGAVSFSYQAALTPSGELLLEVPTTNPFSINQSMGQPLFSLSRQQLDIIDKIKVDGQTISAAEKKLGERFSRYLHRVSVTITLLVPRRFKVFVLGEVKAPGNYIGTAFFRVADLISKAQGVTAMGSRCAIELRRRGKFLRTVDLEQYERYGDLEANPPVADGDIIYVPLMKKYVRVRGGLVGRTEFTLQPGDTMRYATNEIYELRPGETFYDIVFRAGGPIPLADLKKSFIERFDEQAGRGSKIPVDLDQVINGSAPDPVLESGDVVVVPIIEAYVYVHGAVAKPGSYWFEDNRRVSDFVGRAGGFNARADIRGVIAVNSRGRRISTQGDPVVERGTAIYVPERSVYNWQLFLGVGATIGATLSALITAWIAISRL